MTVERPVEIELKYAVAERAIGERLLGSDTLAGFRATGPTRTTQNEDRYFDSAGGALARAGFSARLRSSSAGTVVTVKSSATVDGSLQRREELEGPADRTAEPLAWPPSSARSLILELCGDAPLIELVTIRQLRRKRDFVAPGGEAVVELSLDEADVVARGRVVERFLELELELTQGTEADLGPLRALLDGHRGLAPAPGSKLERALAAGRGTVGPPALHEAAEHVAVEVPELDQAEAAEAAEAADEPVGAAEVADAFDREPGTPGPMVSEDGPVEGRIVDIEALVDEPELMAEAEAAAPLVLDAPTRFRVVDRIPVGKTPGVSAEDLHAEAGRKVLRFHLARMIDREPGTREGKDPEELHAMRVATRRMRAAWRVFGDGFRPDRTKRFRRRLQLIAARLGTVRDLDVLIEATEAFAETLPAGERGGLQPLLDAWRAQREAGRTLLIQELDSGGHRRFIEDYRDFVMTPGAEVKPIAPTIPHRVRDTAGSRILLAYEHVRAYESVLRWADVATLHELRIAAKRLRYTVEFVREALGPEAPALISRVVALQDHLGMMNDAEVAAHFARAFLVDHAGDLTDTQTAAISRYLVARERDVARLKRTVGVPWRGVSSLTFRRALGRTIAAL
jgi:CHAD domain-containing protein